MSFGKIGNVLLDFLFKIAHVVTNCFKGTAGEKKRPVLILMPLQYFRPKKGNF